MVRYELKKVFSRRMNQIVVVLLAATLMVVTYFGIVNIYYYVPDDQADYGTAEIYGPAAAKRLHEDTAPYEGLLTEDVIRRVIEDHLAKINTPEYQSGDITLQNLLYCKTQGYRDIHYLISCAYTGFRDLDFYAIDRLQPEDAARFYDLRVENLTDWLNSPEAADLFTEEEKDFLIQQYSASETPWKYEMHDGWKAIFEYAPTLCMIMVFLVGFLVAGIFSSESQLKADAIFYSTYHGRKKAIRAKILAGLILINVVYWAMLLIYTAIMLGIFGTSGWDCPIQITGAGWKSFYNITIFEKYLIILFSGYIGVTVICLLTMLVSAKTGSSMVAVVVPFAVIIIPDVLDSLENLLDISSFLGLLPDQLLQMSYVLRYFNLYSIGGKIMGSLHILPWIYLALSVVLVPVIYRVFRKKQVV